MLKKEFTKRCAYCGGKLDKKNRSKEHVFPKCLYPDSRKKVYNPITVPACNRCNNSWADSEARFRNVIALAGDSNSPVSELFSSKITRSFDEIDGERRKRDLRKIMKPVQSNGLLRHKIYPAEDPEILKVIQKIVIGLYYHHGFGIALNPNQIGVDIQRIHLDPALFEEMATHSCEADIVLYKYKLLEDERIHSGWIFLFFERTPFIAIVYKKSEKYDI